jgi:hypothetical protein
MTITRYAPPDIDAKRAATVRFADTILGPSSSGRKTAIALGVRDPPQLREEMIATGRTVRARR